MLRQITFIFVIDEMIKIRHPFKHWEQTPFSNLNTHINCHISMLFLLSFFNRHTVFLSLFISLCVVQFKVSNDRVIRLFWVWWWWDIRKWTGFKNNRHSWSGFWAQKQKCYCIYSHVHNLFLSTNWGLMSHVEFYQVQVCLTLALTSVKKIGNLIYLHIILLSFCFCGASFNVLFC